MSFTRHTSKLLLLPSLLLLICLLPVSDARAENAVITSGSFSARGTGLGESFNFAGSNFNLNGFGGSGNVAGCSGCRAGDSFGFRAYFTDSDVIGGAGSYNGVAYPNIRYSGAPSFIDFTGFATLPAVDAPLVTITAPFAFVGRLIGCAQSRSGAGQCPGGDIFDLSLNGSGLATLVYDTSGSGANRVFNLRSIAFDFAAQNPAAVPEPATLLLLGTGLAGAVGAARRRRRASAEE